ncbi:MAG: Bro-N domain-containing protein [Syntrophales bacterium]|nr:Bro-N domain-containing protein [Syntrophales bacterium]
METKIAIFRGKGIRKTLHHDEWWFSVIDVVEVLTDSVNPRDYWFKMKIRVKSEDGLELSTICRQFKLTAPDGKMRVTDCSNTEGLFRIIQSIPSPKAEPFKRWLAKVGYERVQEIENPELATKRTRAIYKAKGYSDDWIEKRMRGIAIREELTDEWKKREVKEEQEYAILTAEIAKAAFGVTPHEHKKLKGLKRENLRDHMTDLELIFSMLGEAATTEITRVDDATGFDESKEAARKGGEVAGTARKDLEKKTGKRVVSEENYLTEPESRKQLKHSPVKT